jgi:hypothetical protein
MIFNVISARLYALPVLDSNFPGDVAAEYDYGSSTSATFNVEIEKNGNPAQYSYQWYLDGEPVGDNSASYTAEFDTEGSHEVYCKVSNKAGAVTSRTAAVSVNCKNLILIDVSPKVAVSGSGYSQQENGVKLQSSLNIPCYFRTEILDLSAFKTISGVFDHWSNSNNGYFWKVYDENNVAVKSSEIGFGSQGTFMEETHRIDVSDLAGKHYIEFRRDATSSGTYLNIRKLVLES